MEDMKQINAELEAKAAAAAREPKEEDSTPLAPTSAEVERQKEEVEKQKAEAAKQKAEVEKHGAWSRTSWPRSVRRCLPTGWARVMLAPPAPWFSQAGGFAP